MCRVCRVCRVLKTQPVYHFIRATMAEIQRFADIAPTAIGHKIMYDVDFHGFHLPKVI